MSGGSKISIEGAAKKALGGAKQAVGDAARGKKLETEGAIETAAALGQHPCAKVQEKRGVAIKTLKLNSRHRGVGRRCARSSVK